MPRYENGYPITELSAESVSKMAAAEELRLMSRKLDLFLNDLRAKIPLDEEYMAWFRNMRDISSELKKYRANLKRKRTMRKRANKRPQKRSRLKPYDEYDKPDLTKYRTRK